MSLPYKQVLLIGATSGIGAAMADKFITSGIKVIAVGRRQDRLDAFVAKHGSNMASAVHFDVTDRTGMDAFVTKVVQTYPELDCVFINAGIQHMTRLQKPEEVDLEAIHREMTVNYTAMVDLSVKFLGPLLAKSHPATMIFTGTHLALVPAATLPGYSASKAAAAAFFECLRRQNQGSNVKFIQVSPPLVQSELHDHYGPDGRKMGMPTDEFASRVYDGLVAGKEEVSIGAIAGSDVETWDSFTKIRDGMFEKLSDLVMRMM